MVWSDIPRNPAPKTLRQFAGACLLFFGILAAREYHKGYHIAGEVIAAVALVVGIAGLIKPSLVRWIFVGWMMLAFPVGWLVSQVMLGLMFYVVLTPVAFLFRLRGRDLLLRKRQPNRTSYWVPARKSRDVRSYFRQH